MRCSRTQDLISENGYGMVLRMRRDDIIAILRQHEAELKQAGIVRIALFGSVARGEEGNDVDLVTEFDEAKQISLLDLVGIENRLSDLLGRKVDLAQRRSLKERVRKNVDREAILAF